jgi:hypothetical protein
MMYVPTGMMRSRRCFEIFSSMKALQHSATCFARTEGARCGAHPHRGAVLDTDDHGLFMDLHAGRCGGSRESQCVIERMQVAAAVVAQATDVATGVQHLAELGPVEPACRRVTVLVGQFVLVRPQVRFLPRLERGMQVAPVQVAVDAVLLDQALQQVECVDRDVEHLPCVGLAHLCDQPVLAASVADDGLAAAAP